MLQLLSRGRNPKTLGAQIEPIFTLTNFTPQAFPQEAIDNWGGANGGTYFLDVEFATPGHPSTGFGIYADNATNNDRVGWTASNLGRLRVYSEEGNDNRLDQVVSDSIFQNFTRFKICLTWDADRLEFWVNGWLVFYQDTPSFLTSTPVRTGIAQYNGGSDLIADTYHEARYYNRRIPRSLAAELTRCLDCNDYTGIADDKAMNAVLLWGQSNINFGVDQTRTLNNPSQLYNFDMEPVLSAFSEPYDANPTTNPYDNLLNDNTLYTAYPGKLLDTLAGGLGGKWCAVGAAKTNTSMKEDWGWSSFANDIYFGSFNMWAVMERARLASMKFNLRLANTFQGESDALTAVNTSQAEFATLTNECFILPLNYMVGSVPIVMNTIAGWYSGLTASGFDEALWGGVQAAQLSLAGGNIAVNDNSDIQDGTLHFGFSIQDQVAQRNYESYLALIDEIVSLPEDPRVTVFYDSQGNYFKTRASVTGGYNDEVENYFTTGNGVQDMSTDGCFLLKSSADAAGGSNYLIDDTSGYERSALYSTLLSTLTTNADTSDAIIQFGGTNDANASSGITKDAYKAGLKAFKGFIKEDFVNVQTIIINSLGAITGGDDANAQIIREALLEIVAEDPFFRQGIEYYDQARRDPAHPEDTAFSGDMAARQAKNLARYAGKEVSGAFGPDVESASMYAGMLSIKILPDGGTDINVTSGCEDTIGLDMNGAIIQPSKINRISASEIRADFSDADFDVTQMGELKVVYGALGGLTQATPEVVADDNGLPLRTKVLTPAQADPLIGMAFTYDMQPVLGAKTLSGSDITSIAERAGNNFTAIAGYRGTFNDTRGSIVCPDETTGYVIDTGFTGSAEHFAVIAFYKQPTVTNNGVIWGVGTASGVQPTPRTSIMLTTADAVQWYQNETSGIATIGTAVDGWNILVLNFKSASECEARLNSETAITFDPRDNMSGQTHVWFGGGNHSGASATDAAALLEMGRVWGRNSAHGEAGDASISDIITAAANAYGVVLS